MCKFYRYLIYKLYSWGLKRANDTPVANVIITLSVVHLIQLLTVYSILARFMRFPKLEMMSKWLLVIMVLAFMGLNGWIFYNRKRWNSYLKEFEKESKRQKTKGTALVLTYLIGNVLLFYAVLILLYHVFRGNYGI